jgi:hypothetical protein
MEMIRKLVAAVQRLNELHAEAPDEDATEKLTINDEHIEAGIETAHYRVKLREAKRIAAALAALV